MLRLFNPSGELIKRSLGFIPTWVRVLDTTTVDLISVLSIPVEEDDEEEEEKTPAEREGDKESKT